MKANRANYKSLRDEDGNLLEAVFRLQEATSPKTCALEDCALDHAILPYQLYARVYYKDEDKVETFHFACFEYEFVKGRF